MEWSGRGPEASLLPTAWEFCDRGLGRGGSDSCRGVASPGRPRLLRLAYLLLCGGMVPGLSPLHFASCIRELRITLPSNQFFQHTAPLVRAGLGALWNPPPLWSSRLANGSGPLSSVPRLGVWISPMPGPPFKRLPESKGEDRGFLLPECPSCLHRVGANRIHARW